MTSKLERAAKLIRDHVDAPDQGARHAVLRANLVDRVQTSRAPARPLLAGTFAIAAAGAALAAALYIRADRQPLSFVVGAEGRAAHAGTYASQGQEMTMRFSDGSQLVLEPAATLSVASTTAKGASLVLERGRARFDIVHRSATSWAVAAGPYTVSVVGTQFVLGWDPKSERIDLSMQTGAVMVRGPGMQPGIQVRDHEQLVRGGESLTPAPAEPSPPEISPIPGASMVPVGRSAAASSKPRAQQAPSWSALAAEGKFDEIMADADRRGVDDALQSANDADLTALADAARYANRRDVAKRALVTVRARFAGTARAASAAFLLGKMSEDAKDPAEAVRYYDRYAAEAPTGPLAAEAMGRKIQVLRSLGDRDAARIAAETYLEQFPAGPYAPLAREVAGR